MGTSKPSSGPLNQTPLVPTWLPDDLSSPEPDANDSDTSQQSETEEQNVPQAEPNRPAIPVLPQKRRYASSRGQYNKYVRGEGGVKKAIGSYVRKGTGGASNAVRKMGGARIAAGNLLRTFQSIHSNGLNQALNYFNLSSLSASSPEEICVGLTEVICAGQHGGPIDEAIARSAWLETVSELSDLGVSSLEGLTIEQIKAVFIEFITCSIDCRIMQDIGSQTLKIAESIVSIENIERQVHDYIRNSVRDACESQFENINEWSEEDIGIVVQNAYLDTFNFLEANEGEES